MEGIQYLLLSDNTDILLGDFNINYFSNDDMREPQLLTNSLNYVMHKLFKVLHLFHLEVY